MWRKMEDGLPEAKVDVLFLWTWPEISANPIMRIGQIMWMPWPGDNPIIKMEIDYGDAGAWFYTSKDDPPKYWQPLPETNNLPD